MNLAITYLHEGLTQQTVLKYNLVNSKREITNAENVFQRNVNLNLPLFLTSPLWERHGYSLADIHTTLEYFSSIHLWQCALLYNISASNSAIKLAFSTPESMVYGSKAIVIRKIEKVLKNNLKFNTCSVSVLDTIRDDHIPPLPIHVLDVKTYQELVDRIPEQPLNMLDTIYFDDFFYWKDIKVVPLWIEQDALYCIRVLELSVFKDSERVKKESLCNRPLDIVIGDKCFAGVDEAMFFSKSTS